jgi:hypothetical protein
MNSLKHLLWIICGAATLLIFGCKGQETKTVARRELKYTVDSTKIGDECSLGGITFRAPHGWKAADSVMISILRKAADRDASPFKAIPQTVYQDSSTGAFLKVSLLATAIPTGQSFTAWGRQFVDDFRATRRNMNMSEDWLALGGLPAVQLTYSDAQQVYLKFGIEGNPPIELDFAVPIDTWKSMTGYVESSVGSIHKL